jgi:hypothetical protein
MVTVDDVVLEADNGDTVVKVVESDRPTPSPAQMASATGNVANRSSSKRRHNRATTVEDAFTKLVDRA